MAAHAIRFTFLAFFKFPHVSSSSLSYVHSSSQFRAPNHYILYYIRGVDTEVRALLLALLAPHYRLHERS